MRSNQVPQAQILKLMVRTSIYQVLIILKEGVTVTANHKTIQAQEGRY